MRKNPPLLSPKRVRESLSPSLKKKSGLEKGGSEVWGGKGTRKEVYKMANTGMKT